MYALFIDNSQANGCRIDDTLVRNQKGQVMHILIASDRDLQTVIEEIESGDPILSWIVPKTAHAGDICILSHMARGLFATAVILTEPHHVPSTDSKGRYSAEIGEINLVDQPLPHSVLAEVFPTWKWPTYPRSYTTVPEDIEGQLWEVIAGSSLDKSGTIDASVSNEGAAQLLIHFARERDAQLVERKKRSVLVTKGKLSCEVCGFDFKERYGDLGAEFCEVHHLKPLAHRSGNEPTMLEELAIVCSNCHRMLHRRGLISIKHLKGLLL